MKTLRILGLDVYLTCPDCWAILAVPFTSVVPGEPTPLKPTYTTMEEFTRRLIDTIADVKTEHLKTTGCPPLRHEGQE